MKRTVEQREAERRANRERHEAFLALSPEERAVRSETFKRLNERAVRSMIEGKPSDAFFALALLIDWLRSTPSRQRHLHGMRAQVRAMKSIWANLADGPMAEREQQMSRLEGMLPFFAANPPYTREYTLDMALRDRAAAIDRKEHDDE